MDPIRSRNFLVNTSSDPIMSLVTMWLIASSPYYTFCISFALVDLKIFHLIRLVRMACSWAAQIKLSASHFSVPFRNHCHKLSMHHFFSRNCSFLLLLSLSLCCNFSDWLNQINIHRFRSSKQKLSGLFYIVF